MLELTLLLQGHEIHVLQNNTQSHTFRLSDVALSLQSAEQIEDAPEEYGDRLNAALFSEGTSAQSVLKQMSLGARLMIRTEDEALSSIPWELLHDADGWLALRYALIRAGITDLEVQESTGRTRLLFVPSNPLLIHGQPREFSLGVDQEWESLRKQLDEIKPDCDVVKVIPPTINAFQAATAPAGNRIIHFSGHGGLDEKREPFLVFEQPNGAADFVSGSDFRLRVGAPALVVLSACVSAVPGEERQANLAGKLVRQGIPFVLGMQASVPDDDARRFTTAVYRFLFAGNDVPEAVRQARISIADSPLGKRILAIPVLYSCQPQACGRLNLDGSGFNVREPQERLELTNVAAASNGFFGRQRELVKIGARLTAERRRDGNAFQPRTVTLLGVGGIGKTALLHQACERFAWAFPDGVLGILLEPLPSPGDVFQQFERFFGLPDGSALEPEKRIAVLQEQLSGKQALIALDNFESLFNARDGKNDHERRNAACLFRFFEGLPGRGLTFIISSRQCTRLPGEGDCLPVSDLDDQAGAALFKAVSRRKEALPDGLLFELNRRVGGHPLALKLLGPDFDHSAARDLQEYLDSLEKILPDLSSEWNEGRRHDTLQKCFEYTLAQLKTNRLDLYRMLARLSLFCGAFVEFEAAQYLFDFSKTAAEAVEKERKTAQALRELAGRGLLESRQQPLSESEALNVYRVHPALGAYLRRKLVGKYRKVAEQAYYAVLDAFARRAYPHEENGRWVGMQSDAGTNHLVRLWLPDLRNASFLKIENNRGTLAHRTAFFLLQFGDLDGALGLYEESLKIADELGDRRGRAVTLHEMAYIKRVRGDLDGALGLYEESLKNQDELGDKQGRAATLYEMAYIKRVRGDLEGALGLYEESLKIVDELGDKQGRAATLHEMAYIKRVRGDLAGALRLYNESLKVKDELGDKQGRAATLHAMAYIKRVRGDLDGALGLYEESLEIKDELGDRQGYAITAGMMGQLLWQKREYEKGLASLLMGLQILSQGGMEPQTQQAMIGTLRFWRKEIGRDQFETIWKKVTGSAVPEWLDEG